MADKLDKQLAVLVVIVVFGVATVFGLSTFREAYSFYSAMVVSTNIQITGANPFVMLNAGPTIRTQISGGGTSLEIGNQRYVGDENYTLIDCTKGTQISTSNSVVKAYFCQDSSTFLDHIYAPVQEGGLYLNPNASLMFSGSHYENIFGLEFLNATYTTNMYGMFAKAEANLTGIGIGNWDTKNVTDMTQMFCRTDFNTLPIENWNVSKVYSFTYMFEGASFYQLDFGKWNMNSVGNYRGLLYGANMSKFYRVRSPNNWGNTQASVNTTLPFTLYYNTGTYRTGVTTWYSGRPTNRWYCKSNVASCTG